MIRIIAFAYQVNIKNGDKTAAKKAEEEQLRMLARVEASKWEVRREANGDRNYYTNVVSGVTSWDMPSEVDQWDQLHNLQTLRVSRNRLAAIPESLTNCPVLDTLEFADNLVIALPRRFSSMPALRIIDFCNNQIRFLPKSIDRLKSTLEVLKV